MSKRLSNALMVLSLAMLLTVFTGCGANLTGDPNGTGDPNNPGGTGSTDLTIVKTGVKMHCQAKILAGDDLVVYGTGQVDSNKGVDYIVPSAGNTTGRGITNGEDWCSYAFAIAGKKIGLVKDDFSVAVYNTTNSTLSTISKNDVKLDGIATGAYSPGNIQGDGNYFVVTCDAGSVTDGKALKIIDVSGATPQVISFSKESLANQIQQYAVDGTAKKVVAATSDKFYVFDIAQPTADPVVIDNPNGTSEAQMVFKNGKILFLDYSKGYLRLADVASKQITLMTLDPSEWDAPATIDIDMNGGKLGFFMKWYSNGASYRGAVGNVSSAPSVSTAPEKDSAVKIDGSTHNNGHLGFASTVGIASDGSKVFIAGWQDIGQGEYLQYSTGGVNFALVQGTGGDAWGFPASDVSASNNVAAFKGGQQSDTYVCYIKW